MALLEVKVLFQIMNDAAQLMSITPLRGALFLTKVLLVIMNGAFPNDLITPPVLWFALLLAKKAIGNIEQ